MPQEVSSKLSIKNGSIRSLSRHNEELASPLQPAVRKMSLEETKVTTVLRNREFSSGIETEVIRSLA